MGYFRRHKASRHTREECRIQEDAAINRMINTLASWSAEDNTSNRDHLEAALEDWASWRECRARIEGENESGDTR